MSETDDAIEVKLQCDINHGPEWNMDFSIPIKSSYSIVLIVGSSRSVIIPNKSFSFKIAFD